MPKMGFEMLLAEVEKSYPWPGTTMQRYCIPAEDLKKYGLKRKKGDEGTHCSIWVLGVGGTGEQMTYFYGHRLLDVAKKAHEWKFGAVEQTAASG